MSVFNTRDAEDVVIKRAVEEIWVQMDFTKRLQDGWEITGATCQGTNEGLVLGTAVVDSPLVKVKISAGTPDETPGFVKVVATAHDPDAGVDTSGDETLEGSGALLILPDVPQESDDA